MASHSRALSMMKASPHSGSQGSSQAKYSRKRVADSPIDVDIMNAVAQTALVVPKVWLANDGEASAGHGLYSRQDERRQKLCALAREGGRRHPGWRDGRPPARLLNATPP